MNIAITKIWNIAKSKDGNLSNSLHRSLLYIVNSVKTDGGVLVGGVNVMPDAELAYEQMCETKQTFGKELGRQGYHVVLSCPVGEGDRSVTPWYTGIARGEGKKGNYHGKGHHNRQICDWGA